LPWGVPYAAHVSMKRHSRRTQEEDIECVEELAGWPL
jgi:hypothetical protein